MKFHHVIIFLLVSCTNISKDKVKENITLQLVDQISFEVDSITNVKSFHLEVFEDNGIEYLVTDNSFKPSIRFYNLTNRKFSHEIPIKMIGPHGVGNFKGFHIKSIDSVFILNFSESRLFLVDDNGEIINKWSWIVENDDLKFEQSTPIIYTGSPAILENDIFSTISLPAKGPTSDETYKNGGVNFQYNLTSNEYLFNYNYPQIYQKDNYPHFWEYIFRCKSHDDKSVYSFSADPHIYITEDYTNSQKFYAGTSIFSKPISNPKLSIKNFLISTAYMGIFYDKYRKVYYRVVVGSVDDEKNITKYDKPISIIILNDSYEIIGEVELPEKQHDYLSIFVAREGLYISNYNEKNSMLDENFISFSIYALSDEN